MHPLKAGADLFLHRSLYITEHLHMHCIGWNDYSGATYHERKLNYQAQC